MVQLDEWFRDFGTGSWWLDGFRDGWVGGIKAGILRLMS
jgi:hypothetical protein